MFTSREYTPTLGWLSEVQELCKSYVCELKRRLNGCGKDFLWGKKKKKVSAISMDGIGGGKMCYV